MPYSDPEQNRKYLHLYYLKHKAKKQTPEYKLRHRKWQQQERLKHPARIMRREMKRRAKKRGQLAS